MHAMRAFTRTSDASNISSASTASPLDHETHDLHMPLVRALVSIPLKKLTMAEKKSSKKQMKKARELKLMLANGSTFDFDTSLRAACFILKQIEWC